MAEIGTLQVLPFFSFAPQSNHMMPKAVRWAHGWFYSVFLSKFLQFATESVGFVPGSVPETWE